MRYRIQLLTLLYSCLLLSSNVTSHEIDSNLDLMHRFSVTIDTKPENVWPFLFQGDKWQWFAKVKSLKLTGDQQGGIVGLYADAKADTPDFLIKTIKADMYKHYGFSIYGLDEQFYGFGAFDLEANGNKTYLTYELYLHNLLSPPLGATDEQIRELVLQREQGQKADKNRKLAVLKALVESLK